MIFKTILQNGGRLKITSLQNGWHLSLRHISVDVDSVRLGYSEYGDPSQVVSVINERIKCELKPGQVLAKYLLSPVNPADINVLQGKYPIRPPLPATGGGEGVAEIISVGGDTDLKPGDWVLPARPMIGTWRSHVVCDSDTFIRVRNDMPVLGAATMLINPCTAYRMLKDYVDLKPGDYVIQNGANSAVGQAVIQIAKTMGVKTINIVRDREEIDPLKKKLQELGADFVLTEKELRATQIFKSGEVKRPVLAFNCVGGDSSSELCKALGQKGIMVTYGGMSRKPVTLATSHLIFKQIQLHGIWLGQWKEIQGRSAARLEMYENVASMISKGEVVPPDCNIVNVDKFTEVLDNTLAGFLPAKYVFKFS